VASWAAAEERLTRTTLDALPIHSEILNRLRTLTDFDVLHGVASGGGTLALCDMIAVRSVRRST